MRIAFVPENAVHVACVGLVAVLALTVSVPVSVSVGGATVMVPAPQGFAPVPAGATALLAAFGKFVPATNEQLLVFIPDTDVAAIAGGQTPTLVRYFIVQTSKRAAAVETSAPDFDTLKRTVIEQNQQRVASLKGTASDLFDKANRGLAKELATDPRLKQIEMIPLPPHQDDATALASSMFVRVPMSADAAVADGGAATTSGSQPSLGVTPVTMTFVLVQGKVLFLYAYGGEQDLTWTRQASTRWAADIMRANANPR